MNATAILDPLPAAVPTAGRATSDQRLDALAGERRGHGPRPPLLLVCPPDHFEVSYRINPWMDPAGWAHRAARLRREARVGWQRLVRTYATLGAEVLAMPPVEGLPDLVFTANAALVLDGRVLLARFRNSQRQGETTPDRMFFERMRERGLLDSIHQSPEGVCFEGAGDAAWDAHRGLVWAGWGQRSDLAAHEAVQAVFGVPTVPLRLVSARYYHLDTCLTVLSGGEILWHPAAFDEDSQRAVRERAGGVLIEAGEADAERLAVNAVCLGRDLVMGHCSAPLRDRLVERGYAVHTVPMGAFNRSGGSALCLTLRLDARSGGRG
jgi:N-dimethylarginine dimethylaminohydrolase